MTDSTRVPPSGALPTLLDGTVSMPREEFEELLAHAAQRGAQRALADVGLDGEHAAADVRELRNLLQALQLAKQTVWTTVVKLTTTGLVLALVAGAAIKLKVFGGEQ